MKYQSNLGWQKKLKTFSEAELKVLMALSVEKYSWRTRDRIASATGFGVSEVDKILAVLIEKGFVRPSMSRKKNIIFGLIERVGE